jgi:hypothetical protein
LAATALAIVMPDVVGFEEDFYDSPLEVSLASVRSKMGILPRTHEFIVVWGLGIAKRSCSPRFCATLFSFYLFFA